MQPIRLTRADVGDKIHVRLQNADGTPIPPIPSGATVVFRMVRETDGHVVTGSAGVVGANSDEAIYTTVTGDASKVGLYQASFRVVYASGVVRTFPTTCPKPDGLVVEVVG